uniref:Ral guanine nucleotide dissociation stimulator like 2 n=1 Tax=Chelonoidis abingdonii TaxID=106734 RepID=A0A8C0FYE8_CHEAB
EDGPEGGVSPRGDPDPLDILIFQADHVASQLTLVEAALFLRVVPYQCLGSLWSQRDKKGRERDCPSVRATVHQFNRLAGAVIRSCLARPGLRPQQRARILEKWIHVAEECRALRNFSSLCAIISALQSSPVHRLKRTWDETARDALRSYEELSTICSEQDNYSLSRQLLFQVRGHLPPDSCTSPPSCPTSSPPATPAPVPPSCPTSSPQPPRLLPAPHPPFPLSPLPLVPFLPLPQSQHCALRCPVTPSASPQHMKWPSVSALDTAPEDVGSSAGGLSPPTPTGGGFPRGHRRSASCGSAFPAPPNPESGHPPSDCCIIRARMALHNGSLYKSILVTSQDKTPSVIAKVLEKHGQERGAAPQFQLVQLLPEGKELTFPPTANVFYAMNGSSLDFVLRPKSAQEPPLPPSAAPRRAELSATFPKIKATGRKLARALF